MDGWMREWMHACAKSPPDFYSPTLFILHRRGPEPVRGRRRARQRRAPAAKRLPLHVPCRLWHERGGCRRHGADRGAGESYVGRGVHQWRRPGVLRGGGRPAQDGRRGSERAGLNHSGPGGWLRLPWGGHHADCGGAVCPRLGDPGPERGGDDLLQRGRGAVGHLRAQFCHGHRPLAKDLGRRGTYVGPGTPRVFGVGGACVCLPIRLSNFPSPLSLF